MRPRIHRPLHSRRMATMGLSAAALVACGDGGSPTELPQEGPDLIVSTPDAPDRLPYGRPFYMRVSVLNRGTRPAAATQVRFLLSDDQTITAEDVTIGSEFTDSLGVSEELTAGMSIEPPHRTFGTLYYGACVDPLPDELDTTNNCSTAATVEIYLAACAAENRSGYL